MTTTTYLLIIALSMLTIAFLICFLWDYCEYRENTCNKPKMKFKAFRTFYDINPSRWELWYNSVECKIPKKSLFSEKEAFCFNYIDTLRYHHWYNVLHNHKQEQSNNKSIAKMLSAVKQDIADLETKAQREQNEALETLRNITNVKS